MNMAGGSSRRSRRRSRSHFSNRSRCRSRRQSRVLTRNRRSRSRSRSETHSAGRLRSSSASRRDRSHLPCRQNVRSRFPVPDASIHNKLSEIMNRLTTIENSRVTSEPNKTIARCDLGNMCGATEDEVTSQRNVPRCCTPEPQASTHETRTINSLPNTHLSTPQVNSSELSTSDPTKYLVDALRSLQPIRTQNYFVSNFDPSIHNIDAWCEEVDRARETNGWSDCECLSRIGSCLKGDAKTWLNEWVAAERTWTNFKLEFKALCPRELDYANILFETMNTTSDTYVTYAEYARRTLLRLRIVKGLSDDLMTLIVIRGIDSPQIRAAAANANLSPETIVSFLSIYTKPVRTKSDARASTSNKRLPQSTLKRNE